MRKVLSLMVLLLFCFTVSKAQQVKLLTVSQLEKRLEAGKDSVYIVNFWATWCAPCVAELPNFERLQTGYKDQKVKVLLVSLDFKSKLQSTVIPFVNKQNFSSEVYLLNESNQQQYIDKISKEWTGAIPASLFVNKAKGIKSFQEKEFTYKELEKTYQSIK